LHISRAYTLPQCPGEDLGRAPSNTFIERLGVATSRAFERRLGRPPSQADVCGVVNTLTSRPSRFLLCAERAQARLARLHSELQKSQENTDVDLELIVSPIESCKRPLEEPDHNSSDPPREIKRARLESGNPNPQNNPPPFKPENAVQAPSAPMPKKHASVAPQGTLSDPQLVKAPRVDCTSPHARIDFPKQAPVTDIGQSTSPDLPKSSNSDREIEQRTPSHKTVDPASHGNRGHTEGTSLPARRDSLPTGPLATQTPAQETVATAPPPSAANSASGRQQSLVDRIGYPTSARNWFENRFKPQQSRVTWGCPCNGPPRVCTTTNITICICTCTSAHCQCPRNMGDSGWQTFTLPS
jgi:hypothetical protein